MTFTSAPDGHFTRLGCERCGTWSPPLLTSAGAAVWKRGHVAECGTRAA